MVVGICGKYCSGKNAVERILKEQGFFAIDVDLLGHQALIEKKSEIVSIFGNSIIDEDGSVSRKELGSRVFRDADQLKTLESIVHPWMKARAEGLIESSGSRYIAINAAVLVKMGLHTICDTIINVKSPLPLRIKRALRRDDLSLFRIIGRIWAQRALSPQSSLNNVDIYSVENNKGLNELEKQVLGIIDRLN